MTNYRELANQKRERQINLEAVATGNTAPKRTKSGTKTQLCVSISPEDKEVFQDYCRKHGATTAGMIRLWIQEHCKQD